jgi:GntR family transcriptional regulator / MocR family aminotransferase
MLTYFLDKQSKIPLYEQLYTQIRDEIHQGILVVNQPMPSKRHLSAHLKVSIQTIETTYEQLVAEGYLRSIPRTGYFVEEALLAPKRERQKTYSLLNRSKSEVTTYQFDLKTNAIDPLLFPSLIWAKMTRLVLSEANTQFWNQTELLGMKELREGISNHLARFRGMHVHPDQIVIGNGSEYLLGLISMMFPQELSIAVENPSYSKISKLYQAFGRKIESIELDAYGLNIKQLRESNASIVHITPSHQFPTGKVMSIKRRLELLQWAHEKPNRFIIEDDYDSEFRFTGQPIPSLQGLEAHHHVIYLNSFSKTLAPALRMGFMVLP